MVNSTFFFHSLLIEVANCGCSADFETLASCKGKRSLHAMFQCFECFLPVVRGRLVLLEQLAFRFVEAQAAQSVLYTEVTNNNAL